LDYSTLSPTAIQINEQGLEESWQLASGVVFPRPDEPGGSWYLDPCVDGRIEFGGAAIGAFNG